MTKVSIVVPIYKTEQYLKRCVDSLIHQTLKDIEIILVDDGSPDNCPAMCEELAETDSRIKIVHKKNGGLSSARNAGMRVAEGEYIGFVDSDDDVEADMYERMADIADRENVDFVMSDYKRVLSNGHSYLKSLNITPGKYDKEKIITDIYPSLIMGTNIDYGPLLSVWHCIYRKSFLDEHQLYFEESVKWSEDNLFSAFAGYYADSFYYMKNEALYHYYQNQGTITTSYKKGAWDVYLKMNSILDDFFSSRKDYDFRNQLRCHLLYYACNCISKTASLEENDRINEISYIVNNKKLNEALKKAELGQVHWKLKLQLMLMRTKQVSLLDKMVKRRSHRG
ncbi:MAG: glycosyltransferase [Solobacterium sp.]|nr:glycosyltransferase [Solobacterium sp.]